MPHEKRSTSGLGKPLDLAVDDVPGTTGAIRRPYAAGLARRSSCVVMQVVDPIERFPRISIDIVER